MTVGGRLVRHSAPYTGHQVYGRRRTRNGHRADAPADQWLWTPEPVRDLAPHPPAREPTSRQSGTSRRRYASGCPPQQACCTPMMARRHPAAKQKRPA